MGDIHPSRLPPSTLCIEWKFILVTPSLIQAHLSSLSHLLKACVDEGSSIGFLSPLSLTTASEYWISLIPYIESKTLHLFLLFSSHPPPEILGTIQLSLIPKITHFHRGEIMKLLVSPSARRKGIARALMAHVEDFARQRGIGLLTLDTAKGSAAVDMYRRLGWQEWGTCEKYARWADGRFCDAVFFRRELGGLGDVGVEEDGWEIGESLALAGLL